MLTDDAIIRDLMRLINDRNIDVRSRNTLRYILNYIRDLEDQVKKTA